MSDTEPFAAVDLIRIKRDGGTLSPAQIDWLIDAYTRGHVQDEQMSAMAMAIYFQGLSEPELVRWTQAMIRSGERMDFTTLSRPTVDKHSVNCQLCWREFSAYQPRKSIGHCARISPY